MKSVGVFAYDLAHNSAGRAHNLAEMYARFTDVELAGPIFKKFGNGLWAPIKDTQFPVRSFLSEEPADFISQAEKLVQDNPYKVVHLSKPRLSNLIFAALYQRIWGSQLIMDVDDEEMAFVNAEVRLDWNTYLREHELPGIERLHGKVWTQLAAGFVKLFPSVTVSNSALQNRYGGEVVPHTRDERRFVASAEAKRLSREKYGIPVNSRVVLYSGTPRKHKGLLETAKAIEQTNSDVLKFVVIGDFPDTQLKDELVGIAGPYLQLIPGQSMSDLPAVAATADIVVLLQNKDSQVAQYQLPAKLVDALACGTLVLMSFTEATKPLEGEPGIKAVNAHNLADTMRSYLSLDNNSYANIQIANRRLFESRFSFDAVAPKLQAIINTNEKSPQQLRHNLSHLLKALS